MSIGAMGRSLVWFAIGVIVVIAGLFAVQHWREPESVVLRMYDVRPEIAHEVQTALMTAFDSGNPSSPYGRVTLSPSGQLLVAAPPSIQSGVATILKDVAAHKPTATPAIHYEVWLVAASSGAPADSLNLKEIEPALAAMAKSTGANHFELLEKLSTETQSGQDSDVQGRIGRLRVTGSVRRDSKDQEIIAAVLRVDMSPTPPGGGRFYGPGPSIKAQTELKPGELLVLGQSRMQEGSETNGELYYVVRATL